jgi:uncharacterized protein YcbX
MAQAAASFLSSFLAGGGGAAGGPAATVTSIFVYPIKSCRGISVPQAPITATGSISDSATCSIHQQFSTHLLSLARIDLGRAGFRWDRQWMLVNSKGRGITQRVEPKLALVQVDLPPEAFAEDWLPTPDDHMGMLLLPSGVAVSGEVGCWWPRRGFAIPAPRTAAADWRRRSGPRPGGYLKNN